MLRFLLEKNPIFGRKLLLTGGGRCNVTNNKTNVREMLERYKEGGKFLFSAFAQHSVEDTVSFFEGRGMALKEENEGRLFPVTDSSQTVRDTLVEYMKEGGVKVRGKREVKSIIKNEEKGLFTVSLEGGQKVVARACVVAAGGVSHPETGSTGECFEWLASLGHNVADIDYSLVPIALKDAWVKKLSGVSVPEAKLTIVSNEKKHSVHTGKLLFTHFGVSGPVVLNLSKIVGELLLEGSVTLMLDIVPNVDVVELRAKLQALLTTESNKQIKNVLSALVPSTLVLPLLTLAEIDGDTPCHSVRSEERVRLVELLKAVPLHVERILGADKAIVSSGGISPEEVNFKTMESRVVSGLYIVGDVLNIDRPSGGYSLQLCWTTGFVAGSHA